MVAKAAIAGVKPKVAGECSGARGGILNYEEDKAKRLQGRPQTEHAEILPRLARQQFAGKARRVWVMDHGVPTEAVLAEMRNSDPPVQYLVGTPKGRLNRLEKHLLERPLQDAREGVQVKLLAEAGELYVFVQSADRVSKERAMRRRQLNGCGSGSGKSPPWTSRAKNC